LATLIGPHFADDDDDVDVVSADFAIPSSAINVGVGVFDASVEDWH